MVEDWRIRTGKAKRVLCLKPWKVWGTSEKLERMNKDWEERRYSGTSSVRM